MTNHSKVVNPRDILFIDGERIELYFNDTGSPVLIKDPSDFEVLKYYMDVIPVYDVLIKREFVKYVADWNSPVSPVFSLNVDLDEFQQVRIQELITKRLEQWNKEHDIPDNEFPDADTKNNINWKLHKNTTITRDTSTPKWKQIVEEEGKIKKKGIRVVEFDGIPEEKN